MENIKMTEWKTVKIGDLGKIITGKTPSTKVTSYWGNDVPFVTPRDIQISRYIYMTEKLLSTDGMFSVRSSVLPKNAVCVSCIGNIGYVSLTLKECVSNQQINSIVVSDENDACFVYYLMKSLWGYFKKYEGQSTALSILNKSQFSNIDVNIPPLEIQRKIAGILGVLDDRIDVLRQENVVLEQMAQAVFQSWFVDFDIVRAKAAGTPESEVCEKYHITPELYALFPSALTPDNLPLGWEKKKLGDLAFNASETHTAQDVEKLIFINTSDVKNGVFLHNKYSVRSEMPGQAKKSIKENDILYSEIRPINKHFAFVNFDSKDYIVSTKFMIIRSFDINNVFYIYFFLTLKETLNSFQALAENRSGTFPQITFESISKTEIVFSNRELHWYFSDYLKKTYTKIFENEKQIRTLEQTRDALLPKLMNGEIEV